MRHGARLRRLLFAPDVRNDHRTAVPDLHLRTVILTDANTLDEAEAEVSQATAARTSGYTSTGITVAVGIERLLST
jgi:hypothetical protein